MCVVSTDLKCLVRVGAEHDKTDGETGGLADHGVVLVQIWLELLVDVEASGAHGGEADAETRAVLDGLARGRLELREQVVDDGAAVVGVYEAEGVEAAAVREGRAVGRVLGQVGGHEAERLLLVALVYDAETGGGRELGPVGGTRQPVEVVAQELIARRAAVHERVADDGGRVTNGVAHGVLDRLEHEHVRVVVLDEELHLHADGDLAVEDGEQALDVGLDLATGCCCWQLSRLRLLSLDLDTRCRGSRGGRQCRRRAGVHVHGLLLDGDADECAQQVLHVGQELLGGVLVEVEAQLIGHEHVALAHQRLEHVRHLLGLVQIDQTLHHVHVVRIGQVRVDLDEQLEYGVAELAVLDERERDLVRVRNSLRHVRLEPKY